MNPIFERALPALRLPAGAAPWYALYATWICATLFVAALVRQDSLLTGLAQSNEKAYSISNPSSDPRGAPPGPPLAESPDFVSALPHLADPDATFRFTARLAQDQGVRISRVESEPVAVEANKLGQMKFTLQLRGDYARIKNVMIDVLAKFPGLTLQRLTIHHRDPAPGNPADAGSDEASLELIQFLRPAALP